MSMFNYSCYRINVNCYPLKMYIHLFFIKYKTETNFLHLQKFKSKYNYMGKQRQENIGTQTTDYLRTGILNHTTTSSEVHRTTIITL